MLRHVFAFLCSPFTAYSVELGRCPTADASSSCLVILSLRAWFSRVHTRSRLFLHLVCSYLEPLYVFCSPGLREFCQEHYSTTSTSQCVRRFPRVYLSTFSPSRFCECRMMTFMQFRRTRSFAALLEKTFPVQRTAGACYYVPSLQLACFLPVFLLHFMTSIM